jgi:membrane protease YdiL (CAAX protease family)
VGCDDGVVAVIQLTMMWGIRSITEVLTAVLPLIVGVMLTGLIPARYEPDSTFLASQRWGYQDLIIVLGVLTFSQLVSPPGASKVTGMARWAIDNGSSALLITASVWGVVRWRHRRPWQTLGFDPATALYNTLWALRIGLGLVSVLTLVVLLVRSGAMDTRNAAYAPGRPVWHDQLGGFIAAVVVTTVLIPIAEELFFRGLAYGPLFRKLGTRGAAIGSATLWAAAHYSGLSYSSIFKMAWVLVLGIVYAEIYRRRESLVPTVTFHIVGNTIAFFIRDRYLTTLVPLAGVSVGLWIVSAIMFHVVNRPTIAMQNRTSVDPRGDPDVRVTNDEKFR